MKDPIDYNAPLGISKRKWTLLLGVNLALLLAVYAIALIFTLTGNDLFLLRFYNQRLDEIETFLRGYDCVWVITAPMVAVEETIICAYVTKRKPSVILFAAYTAFMELLCTVLYFTTHSIPSFTTLLCGVSACLIYTAVYCIKKREGKYILHCLVRFAIAMAVSLLLNEAISNLRTRCYELWHIYSSPLYFALSIEYDLALALAFGFLTLLIPWEKGESRWTCPDVGGCSPTTKNSLPRNLPKKNNLTPKARRKLTLLKIRVIAIQTVALIVIAFVPAISGRGVEFTLMYIAFCVTRLILGFSHSLHFKSELTCVTVGALTFWGVTFLAPNVATSIIVSLLYGVALALGFRLYWELHDLMMYRKAAKTDRYAMFYTAFKGNLDPRRIRGYMKMRGYSDESDIKMVQMYMAKEKVDYIAEFMGEPVRSLDRKLTAIAEDLYARR